MDQYYYDVLNTREPLIVREFPVGRQSWRITTIVRTVPQKPGNVSGNVGLANKTEAPGLQPPLPTNLLANIKSLENKVEDLWARLLYQREMSE